MGKKPAADAGGKSDTSAGTGPGRQSPTRTPVESRIPLTPRVLSGSLVHSQIAGEIGRRIVQGEYPPGTVLPNEAQWSEAFGVSRTAVREAIKMLMAKNLLSSRPKIGSRVEPRDQWNLLDRDVLEWYSDSPERGTYLRAVQEFRYIIEPEAAALAAERRSPEQMAEISRACAEMGSAPNLQSRTKADTRFHVSILRAAGNDLLMPLGVMIGSALEKLFVHVTREANDIRHAQGMHEDIERHIRLQHPEAARRAVKRLLANTDSFLGHSAALP